MNKRRFIGLSVLVLLSLLLSLLVSGCQNRPSAQEIVAKLREVEASTEDAHAVLEISIQGQMEEEVVVEVWEKRPNKFRGEVLEASDPELVGIVSVTDGHQGWAYNPSENEVIVGEAGQDERTDPRQILQLAEDSIQQVLDASEVKLVGEENVAGVATYKLEFIPKEGEESVLPVGSKAILWVDQQRWVVLQAHFIGDIFGEAWVRVRSFELNTGLADDNFQFEVPEGAQVIDIKDMQPKHLTLDEARAQAEFTLLVPTYVPEGATLIDVFAVEGAFVLYYDHSTTSFTVSQGLSPVGETPDGQTSEVTVRGQTGTLITDDLGNGCLTWTEDGVVISIAGRISQDEIVKVAESMQ
jgi:outer membrane lipoprotein-sorting protein